LDTLGLNDIQLVEGDAEPAVVELIAFKAAERAYHIIKGLNSFEL
jgi:hypothetical protein